MLAFQRNHTQQLVHSGPRTLHPEAHIHLSGRIHGHFMTPYLA